MTIKQQYNLEPTQINITAIKLDLKSIQQGGNLDLQRQTKMHTLVAGMAYLLREFPRWMRSAPLTAGSLRKTNRRISTCQLEHNQKNLNQVQRNPNSKQNTLNRKGE